MPSDRAQHCPVCLATNFIPIVRRAGVPVFQNVLFKYRSEAVNVDRATLQIVACTNCGFVFNAAFDPGKAHYDQLYDNNQTHSVQFTAYLDEHIRHLVRDVGVCDCTIVEVGSGNGWFLERLVAAAAGSNGVGFDPAYRGPERSLDGRVRYLRRYFSADDAELHADIVVCRHVIEHVADPVSLLRSVRAALARSPAARVFFETPCVKWILRNEVFWDFFYEHCSYFGRESIQTAFHRAGLHVERVEHVFGGQYLWIEAVPQLVEEPGVPNSGDVPALATSFASAEPALLERSRDQVQTLRRQGNVAVWGAGAKGVTFLNLIDPQAQLIDCAIDVSPDKQGRFVGGTGHPVVGVEELAERRIASALLMNPNYRAENLRLLQQAGAELALV